MPSLPHHCIDYIEIPVRDVAAAKRFYGEAFGWKFNDYGPAYAGIRRARGGEAGGLRLAKRHRGRAGGGPLVILHSRDLKGTVSTVKSAGGVISQKPYAFPGGRRFHFKDPSGNELAVWSPS